MDKLKILTVISVLIFIFVIGFLIGRMYIENTYTSLVNNLEIENSYLKESNQSILKSNNELNIQLGEFQRQINNSDTRN